VTEPLTFLHPELGRVYGKTQVEGLNWSCPDCGAVVEFLTGRPIHNRWHASMRPIEARFHPDVVEEPLRFVCEHGSTEPHRAPTRDGEGSAAWWDCPGAVFGDPR
jgi:hypothetical protein